MRQFNFQDIIGSLDNQGQSGAQPDTGVADPSQIVLLNSFAGVTEAPTIGDGSTLVAGASTFSGTPVVAGAAVINWDATVWGKFQWQ